MRSVPRDQNRRILSGVTITDAASGIGFMQPGNIAYSFARSGTGVYDITIVDPRVAVITAIGSADDPGSNNSTVGTHLNGPSSVRVMTRTMNTGAPVNSSFSVQINAVDKR